jgi:hypothetical protein
MTLFCLLLFLSSKNSNESIQITKHSTHEIKKKVDTKELAQYNHAVTGTDENRQNNGNINIVGEIGLGTLIRNDAKEEIVVEYIDAYKLITDLEGYEYNLKINEIMPKHI